MDWISKLFTGTAGSLVESVGNVADKFITTKDEKQKFKLELEALLQKRDIEMEETFRSELLAKERVLVAELQQGDRYTKRARPTTVYFGLLVIAFNYCLIPLLQYFSGEDVATIKPFELPEYFWIAWGGIVGTWSIGRSAERIGYRNRVTQAITGSSDSDFKTKLSIIAKG